MLKINGVGANYWRFFSVNHDLLKQSFLVLDLMKITADINPTIILLN
jgi:hypothetical protein